MISSLIYIELYKVKNTTNKIDKLKVSSSSNSDDTTKNSTLSSNEPKSNTIGNITSSTSSNKNNLDITLAGTTSNTDGSTSGNLLNGGLFSQQGKWTYFALPSTRSMHFPLYRSMNDCETGLKEIKNSSTKYCLNVIGGWVYYIDNANSNSISRTSTDGSNTQIVIWGPIDYFYISNGYIYYIKTLTFKELNVIVNKPEDIRNEGIEKFYGLLKNQGIFKIKIYDSNTFKEQLLAQDHFFEQLFVYDNNIFAVSQDIKNNKETTETLYSMNLDGSNFKKVSTDYIFNPLFYKDHIYYSVLEDDGVKLYRINLDGSNKTKISNTLIYSFNIANDWIYYASGYDKKNIYKMKLDGTSTIRLTNNSNDMLNINNFDAISSIYIIDNSIYYFGRSDNYTFRRVALDGSLEKLIN